MTAPHTALPGILATVIALGMYAVPARAGQTDLCVSCSDPQQTYVCRVDTPNGNPGDKALQLYCIVKTAKQGRHSSCSVQRTPTGPCEGIVVSHVYDGPMIPQALRSEIPGGTDHLPGQNTGISSAPRQKGGEPDTLVEMTGPAYKAGKSAVRTTGRAVRNAATGTGHAIGTVGKKAGRGVGNTARDAGSAVGTAARYTYNCLKSLFRDCRNSSPE